MASYNQQMLEQARAWAKSPAGVKYLSTLSGPSPPYHEHYLRNIATKDEKAANLRQDAGVQLSDTFETLDDALLFYVNHQNLLRPVAPSPLSV